jgi:hypothetical protein
MRGESQETPRVELFSIQSFQQVSFASEAVAVAEGKSIPGEDIHKTGSQAIEITRHFVLPTVDPKTEQVPLTGNIAHFNEFAASAGALKF